MDSQYPPAPYPPDAPYQAEPPSEPPEWLTPVRLPSAPPPDSGRPAIFELRPLTTGEVLDRMFTLYRSRFWLFVGIASMAAAWQTLLAAVQMAMRHTLLRHMNFTAMTGAGMVVGLVVLVLVLMAYSITQAATVFAVSEVYLGRTTTIAESLRAVGGRWYAYIGIAAWQIGSALWVPLLLLTPIFVLAAFKVHGGAVLVGVLLFLAVTAGFVLGFIFYVRNLLAIAAAVVERLKVRASMRRSKVLAAGTKWRIFLVLLISVCLYFAIGAVQMPLVFLVGIAAVHGREALGTEAGMLVIGFLGNCLIMPVAMIGLTLIYFDQRVRKEAFDIAVLLGEEQAPAAGAMAASPTGYAAAGQADDGLAG